MRSSTIVLAVGLLAAPLALFGSPGAGTPSGGLVQVASAQVPAKTGVFVDAPVPRVDPAGISPADRVAGAGGRTLDAGPANGTPFSSTPSGTLGGGGTGESNADAIRSPADAGDTTPNLSR